jgi:predicted ribosomally synthesized peptide with SipW-like signal peptide
MIPSDPPPSPGRGHRRSRLVLKLLASAGILGLVGIMAGAGTMSSLNDTAANPGNTFTSGSVNVTDNDAGTALASFAAGKPGTTASGCVNVTYTGTLPAAVRLYATTTGTGLGAYVDLKITRGKFTGTPAAASCTGFTADTTDYGNGAGIIYNGLLSSMGATPATGVVDPLASSPATWAAGEVHAYKVQVTLRDDAGGQGKNATTAFSWIATNT